MITRGDLISGWIALDELTGANMIKTPKEVLLTMVIRALPYPDQIDDIDITTSEDAIRFKWRRTRFRLSNTFFCEEVGDEVLIGSDLALVVGELIKRAWAGTQS